MGPLDRFEREARRRLPGPVFDYFCGGAADERTMADNLTAWQNLRVRSGLGVDGVEVDCSTELFGLRHAGPIILAPVAAQRLVHPRGELASARAAGSTATIFCLSTRSTTDLVDVAEVSSGALWFQLYVHRDRDRMARILERAAAAGYRQVVLTADLPVTGRRERELRHGLIELPPGITLATHLGRPAAEPHKPEPGGWDPSLNWRDLTGLARSATRPLIVKGILTAQDARLAVEYGAAGVVVSNHGGRQLDGVVPTAVALEEVVDAVAGRIPVIVDGGVRSGLDVFRALALGAQAVMIGRPYVWALAAGGEAAVQELVGWLLDDLRAVMAGAGCRSVEEIGRDHVRLDRTTSGLGRTNQRKMRARSDTAQKSAD
ncbi:MAG TPA: alpha-hydroxy acid oxidase [Solirubrobacteraceae bacterium]|nr:alpha-hydroxy acid oxidase [Solirubrobacteraceae bacterium]